MKPAKLVLATVACLVTWNVGAAEAAFITVDALLDHSDISETNPIKWSVLFPPVLTEIHSVTLDAYWIEDVRCRFNSDFCHDGINSGEGIFYFGVLGDGGGGGFGGPDFHPPVFHITSTFTESYPGGFDHFLDGSAQGLITIQQSFASGPHATATFDRLVFTFDDGVPIPPAPTPEPGSLLLLATGILAGARKLQRRRDPE